MDIEKSFNKQIVLLYLEDGEYYEDKPGLLGDATVAYHYPQKKEDDRFYIIMNKDHQKHCEWFARNNYRFGEDYVDYICFAVIKRKMQKEANCRFLFAYGNCQVKYTIEYLKRYELPDDLYVDHMPLQAEQSWVDKRFEILSCYCDHFFYTRERFVSRYRNVEEYVLKHNSNCQMIAFPCYEFRGYFPQTDENVLRKNPLDIIGGYYSPFHRADQYIDAALWDGRTTEEIVHAVTSSPCFSPEQIQKTLAYSFKKLEILDRLSSIPIGDFVKNNYQHIRAFKDPCHFNEPLLKYIAEQLAKIIGLTLGSADRTDEIHVFTEIPIYPCVYDALGLRFDNDRLTIRKIDGVEHVTIEGYVVQYIEYVKAAKALLEVIKAKNEKS